MIKRFTDGMKKEGYSFQQDWEELEAIRHDQEQILHRQILFDVNTICEIVFLLEKIKRILDLEQKEEAHEQKRIS